MRGIKMATEAPTTTRPARTRSTRAASTAGKATAAKPAAAKPAAAKTEAAPEAPKTDVTRFKVELDHAGTTKSYEKFVFPDNLKGTVVGNVYAPIGTERVAVLIIGAGDTDE